MRVLLVCTANICRSPLAAAMLTRTFGELGLAASIESAGLLDVGRIPPTEVLDELHQRGIEGWAAHQSSVLTPERVRRADLVIGMAREHVREVIALVPEARPYTFTLKELVRRGEAAGARQPNEALTPWLAALDATRTSADLLGPSRADDIDDPFGRSRRAYHRVAAEIEALTSRLVRLLAGAPGS